jgi:hypothetical protein
MATQKVTATVEGQEKELFVDFNYEGKDYEDDPSLCPAYENQNGELNYVGTYNEVTKEFIAE